MFSIYLGNIPADVFLEEVLINGKQLLVSGEPKLGLSIRPVVHLNGSRGYELQLPFDDPAVRWTVRRSCLDFWQKFLAVMSHLSDYLLKMFGFAPQNMGGGVVLYTIDANFTLTVMPHRQSYYYNTVITAQVLNACKWLSELS